MRQVEPELVQPGWEVWTSDGAMLGRIIRIEGPTLTVKKEGILGGEAFVPRDSIREVEEGRVEITLSREEAMAAGR